MTSFESLKKSYEKLIEEKKENQIFCNEDEEKFVIDFTYESNAIEGNKLTKHDVELILEKQQVKKNTDLKSVLEIINHKNSFNEAYFYATNKLDLSEELVKDLHHKLMYNIMDGGHYRDQNVIIKGAKHKPPTKNVMYNQIKYFFETLEDKEKEMEPVEFAAYTHAEFVKIHPFQDGNGRISRIIMNYQLIKKDLLPVNITTEIKEPYFDALEEYALNNNLVPLKILIAKLELKELKKCKRTNERNKSI